MTTETLPAPSPVPSPPRTRRVAVRHTRHEDIPRLIELQRRTYATIAPWSAEKFASQLEVFPQGQVVAEIDGRIVGAASSLIVRWDEWPVEHSWQEITGKGTFDTHDPHGRTLYGAEVFVDRTLRGKGVRARAVPRPATDLPDAEPQADHRLRAPPRLCRARRGHGRRALLQEGAVGRFRRSRPQLPAPRGLPVLRHRRRATCPRTPRARATRR